MTGLMDQIKFLGAQIQGSANQGAQAVGRVQGVEVGVNQIFDRLRTDQSALSAQIGELKSFSSLNVPAPLSMQVLPPPMSSVRAAPVANILEEGDPRGEAGHSLPNAPPEAPKFDEPPHSKFALKPLGPGVPLIPACLLSMGGSGGGSAPKGATSKRAFRVAPVGAVGVVMYPCPILVASFKCNWLSSLRPPVQ